MQVVACAMAQATYTAFEVATKKALAAESGGKSAQSFNDWDKMAYRRRQPVLIDFDGSGQDYPARYYCKSLQLVIVWRRLHAVQTDYT